jgi:hypothetical protein
MLCFVVLQKRRVDCLAVGSCTAMGYPDWIPACSCCAWDTETHNGKKQHRIRSDFIIMIWWLILSNLFDFTLVITTSILYFESLSASSKRVPDLFSRSRNDLSNGTHSNLGPCWVMELMPAYQEDEISLLVRPQLSRRLDSSIRHMMGAITSFRIKLRLGHQNTTAPDVQLCNSTHCITLPCL